jgi:hypothetical protein
MGKFGGKLVEAHREEILGKVNAFCLQFHSNKKREGRHA